MKNTLIHRLREMILSGELPAGERLTEIGLAEMLGVSRTPIRAALPILAADGFLDSVGKRGYRVRSFDPEVSLQELDLRSMLEGAAAKYLCQRGASQELLDQIDACLAEGDAIFEKGYVTEDDEDVYGEMNAKFHSLIVQNCGSQPVISVLEKLNNMPFIGPSVLVFNKVGLDQAYGLLFRAHGHHHALADAIKHRDGTRAEAIFREHGNSQRQSLFSRLEANRESALTLQKESM